MQIVELDSGDRGYWGEVIAGEQQPFGGVGEQLVWRDKTLNFGLRADDRRLLGTAGLVLAEVAVAGQPPFTVAGVGGVIITRAERGRGLGRLLVARLIEVAAGLPVERAMLFCAPERMRFYASFGFRALDAAVWAEQPGGPIEMPLEAMWKPLRDGAGWPDGEVRVLGEPF